MVKCSPGLPMQDLLVRDHPAKAHRVHVHAVNGRAAAHPGSDAWWRPGRPACGLAARPRSRRPYARRCPRARPPCPGGGARSSRPTQIRSRHRGEPHREHGAKREVGGDQHADVGALLSCARRAKSESSIPSRGPYDRMDAGVDECITFASVAPGTVKSTATCAPASRRPRRCRPCRARRRARGRRRPRRPSPPWSPCAQLRPALQR